MPKTIYDSDEFFSAYAHMPRSQEGLAKAGEWKQLQPLIPPVQGHTVLDLGCGYGWHSMYVAQQGAKAVLGLDVSEKMIQEAQRRNHHPCITYQVCGMEAYDYPAARYELVLSNLALHYVADLDGIFSKVFQTLKPGGVFLFNIEHPVFTAGVHQDWSYDAAGNPVAWPVNDYFYPGPRETSFLGQRVTKQHHTLTQILMGVLRAGFCLQAVEEAQPPAEMLHLPGMAHEMRRPMMLLVKGVR